MSSSPCSCHQQGGHQQRSRQLRTERPLGIAGPKRAPKRPDEPGWRRVARRREHSEPVTTSRLQGATTLVRRCRDFYVQRLRQSELLRNKWAAGAASPPGSDSSSQEAAAACSTDAMVLPDGEATWRRSRFDLAMDSLRKEISCLMERDNALFGQLLGLHQSIAELRLARETRPATPAATTSRGECSAVKPPSRPASLESLASSSSSSEPGGCRRCAAAAQLRRRRALSQAYDSGVQLHYGSSHSESDHEVFV
ncbi:uncharacterized protein [Dermacentor andersoni]|uniref:uncharacterized protein n=1 Tax=Dermacentor andersoni TaxID=34620 RepID=UPI0021552140|nr:uncharacterized protein LOC126531844 [Dermacentor andersoni]